MRRGPLFSFALSVATVLGASAEAAAWQCYPEPAELVSPSSQVKAPRNTHVRVRLRHGPMRGDEKPQPCDGPLCDAPGFGLAIRPAGHPDRAVPFAETKLVSGEVAIFDLRPLTALEAETRYEVYRTDLGGRDVRLLATFTTHERSDEVAPVFAPLTGVVFHPFPVPRAPATAARRTGRKVVVLDFFEQFAPYVAFEGPAASDEGTRRSDLAFFVWSVAATPAGSPQPATIDYTRPPEAILSVPELFRETERKEALFFWGSQGICYLDTLTAARPRGVRRVGVRVVDLAGNQSQAQEREIDFGK